MCIFPENLATFELIFLADWMKYEKKNVCSLQFLVFSDMIILVLKIGYFSMIFDYEINHNSKNKDRKNLIHDFSFDSAVCASVIGKWSLLREE